MENVEIIKEMEERKSFASTTLAHCLNTSATFRLVPVYFILRTSNPKANFS